MPGFRTISVMWISSNDTWDLDKAKGYLGTWKGLGFHFSNFLGLAMSCCPFIHGICMVALVRVKLA